MSLQELVTESLLSGRGRSGAEVCLAGVSYKTTREIIEIGEEISFSLDRGEISFDLVLQFVIHAFYTLSENRTDTTPNRNQEIYYRNNIEKITSSSIRILAYARDFENHREDSWRINLCAEIRGLLLLLEKSLHLDPMRNIYYSPEISLDWIYSVFQKETVPLLAEINKVSPRSVRRWLRGGRISSENVRKIRVLAVLFYYLRQAEMKSDQEIRSWYFAGAKGSSPHELFCRARKDRVVVCAELRELARDIGVSGVF